MEGVNVDRTRLKTAIAITETSGGRNNWPRIEAAFLPRGQSYTIQGRIYEGTGACYTPVAAKRYERWGMASAASYGPWQILAHTAWDFGGYPEDQPPWLMWDPRVSEPVVDRLLDRAEKLGAVTPDQYYAFWNTGNVHGNSPYIQAFLKAWGTP